MVDYREILRLDSDPTKGLRSIAALVHSSRNTVREVRTAAQKAGVTWPLGEDVTNEELRDILFPNRFVGETKYAMPDYSYIHRELTKPGVTLTLLWTEYYKKCEAEKAIPYMYTQFCEKYRRWARVTKATMRIQHKPGDAMQVDWAGNTLDIYDAVTGEVSKAYLFVAVLPCSCIAYTEVCGDMQLETWLLCHVHAFNYFGGVPRLLIPDNLKTGVTKNTRYETVLNRSYQELAEHYDTAIVPARVEHPRDKSLAEGTVKFASTWILAALREQKFFSVQEAQEAAAEKLEELNSRPFRKRVGNRRSAYLEEEREFMKPLPTVPYEPAVWTPELKVGLDYLVSDGKNKYSVPFDLIGDKVVLRLTQNMVEVFYRGTRVATHLRSRTIQREPVVKTEHMPPEHRKYLTYNADNFMEWASAVGEHTVQVVKYFLTSGKEPEQGYKPCASMTKLAERYGAERLESACAQMVSIASTPSIRTLSTILKNGYESRMPTKAEDPQEKTAHGFTRGAAYFQKGGATK